MYDRRILHTVSLVKGYLLTHSKCLLTGGPKREKRVVEEHDATP